MMDDRARLIDIGGRGLFTQVRGRGPTIVLLSGADTAGVGGWGPVESRLAKFATVVSYDRAGTGRSDPPATAAAAADMVLDLQALLAALRVTFPVVIVGWSLGALPAQLYACEYPTEVKGLVLLDPTPDVMLGIYAPAPKASRGSPGPNGHLERDRIAESCAQVRRAIEEERRMPNVPMVLLSAGVRADMGVGSVVKDTLLLAHQHMVARVAQGRLVVAQNGSHNTLLSDECDLIIDTIRSVLWH